MKLSAVLFAVAAVPMAAAATVSQAASKASTKTSSSTSSCHTYISTTAKFDNLPTGAPPPNPYRGVSFNGFTVEGAGVLKPRSPPNVAMAGPFGGYIQQHTDQIAFILKSLSFACVSFYPFQTLFPVGCDLKLFTESPTASIQIQEHGPYNFAPDYNNINQSAPVFYMQNVTFDSSVYGNQIWFMISNAPGFSQLVIDSVVIEQFNDTCS